MDSMSAFARGEANRDKEMMVFDWDKAAQVIKDRSAQSASAGLAGDWEWTGGSILAEGNPVPPEETYTFLASTWATPELIVDGERMDCYKMETQAPGWDEKTYWPQSALTILGKSLKQAA